MAVKDGNDLTVKVEGLGRLGRQLKALDPALTKEVTKINREVATVVKATADVLVPRRLGRLAKSIRVGATRTTASVRGGSSVPYAPPIHWGWASHNISPQPFLYEALDHRRTEVVLTYEKQIRSLVDRSFSGSGDN